MHYDEIQTKLTNAEESLKNQYGLRFLLISMLTLSLVLAACRYLASSNETVLSVSLVLATLSIIVGLGFIAYSIFLAILVPLTDENPVLRKISLRRSLNLFIIGTIFLAPGLAIIAMSSQGNS
jgi:hypothetical protein